MVMIGADADQLEALAQRLDCDADQLQDSLGGIGGMLRSILWSGVAAVRFRTDWNRFHRRSVAAAAEDLSQVAKKLRAQAREQRRASEAVGGCVTGSRTSDGRVRGASEIEDRIRRTREGMQQELERLRRERARIGDGFLADARAVLPDQSERERLDQEIAWLERLLADPSRQFLMVDLGGDGRIIEVKGDLTDADHIAIHIPGMSTELEKSYLDGIHGDAERLQVAMDKVTPAGTKNVVISFLDYDPPDNLGAAWQSHPAAEGAQNLDKLVDDLRGYGYSRDQITPIGHSYGSTVIGMSLEDHNLDVARVGVVGSPGLGDGVDDISDLGLVDTEVFAGAASDDLTSWAPAHGEDPTDQGFGATTFDTGGALGHSEYFEDEGSVNNLARIATGQRPKDYGTAEQMIEKDR